MLPPTKHGNNELGRSDTYAISNRNPHIFIIMCLKKTRKTPLTVGSKKITRNSGDSHFDSECLGKVPYKSLREKSHFDLDVYRENHNPEMSRY